VIIGGVAGGATAATRLRRLDERADIIMLEKDAYVSFANCGLPYYLGKEIALRDALLMQTPEGLKSRYNIDARPNSEAVAIDTVKGQVRVAQKAGGAYTLHYDALVLCPGATPVMLPVTEDARPRVFTLRNMQDTDQIHAAMEQKGVRDAVVIGGGFIGVELAENLVKRGLCVRLIEAAPQVLPPLDGDMARFALKELEHNGVAVTLNAPVEDIAIVEGRPAVRCQDGRRFTGDMIICALGVRPATGFLKGSGIALGPKGHIMVNARMQSNIPNIYAAGDAAQIDDFILRTPTAAALAGPANRQARVAADNIAGIPSAYGGAQGTAVARLFSKAFACTGLTERALETAGLAYHKIIAYPYAHAAYYPGARQMAVKLLFHESGKIYGAQAAGADGVDKTVDTIATAMRLGAHAAQLGELELCYAPPFSSVRGPANILGMIADNVITGVTRLADERTLKSAPPNSHTLLDVRTSYEYRAGHLEGAVNIPLDTLRARLDELDKSRAIIVYCQVGARAHLAQRILAQNGFDAKNLTGGYRWAAGGEE
jgi:NADPH-dependent 2,4-dienoyl-CoA reductase/sulfur reductase-like enzyme/rhodanese-related sulfurtransferase